MDTLPKGRNFLLVMFMYVCIFYRAVLVSSVTAPTENWGQVQGKLYLFMYTTSYVLLYKFHSSFSSKLFDANSVMVRTLCVADEQLSYKYVRT